MVGPTPKLSCVYYREGRCKVWKSGGHISSNVVCIICPPVAIGLTNTYAKNVPPAPPVATALQCSDRWLSSGFLKSQNKFCSRKRVLCILQYFHSDDSNRHDWFDMEQTFCFPFLVVQYGNTGCRVFKRGIQNWKDFCLKINIPKENYWILRIGLMGRCQTRIAIWIWKLWQFQIVAAMFQFFT